MASWVGKYCISQPRFPPAVKNDASPVVLRKLHGGRWRISYITICHRHFDTLISVQTMWDETWTLQQSYRLTLSLLANIAGKTVIELYPTFVDMWAQCAPSMQFCTSPQLGPKGKFAGVVPSNKTDRMKVTALGPWIIPSFWSCFWCGFVSHLHWLVSWFGAVVCCHLWDCFTQELGW